MGSDIIRIEYNGQIYNILKDRSLTSMLTLGELLLLPLKVWKLIFELKDGSCQFTAIIKVLAAVIMAYDSSTAVNSFYFNDKEYWLDKATRVGLRALAESSEDEFALIIDGEVISFPADAALEFLNHLEVYAGKCYLTTAKHLQAIKQLKSVEDVINYDYTSGYPNKIILK